MSYSVFMNSIDKLLYKGVEKTCKIVLVLFKDIPC